MLPDRWQALALSALREGRDVVVDAPTGAGKTYIFERWAEQTNFSRRALFTVPTRALANDKFAEWRTRGWRVGIMTGDLCVDPEAPIVVATLEAVQSHITGVGSVVSDGHELTDRAAPHVRTRREMGTEPFRLLVIDEYHWLADTHRGNHYEGVLLAAPAETQRLEGEGAPAVDGLQRLQHDGQGRQPPHGLRPTPGVLHAADAPIGEQRLAAQRRPLARAAPLPRRTVAPSAARWQGLQKLMIRAK